MAYRRVAAKKEVSIDLSRYTDEQKGIIETSITSPKLIINALAGSGKTTTALACASINRKVKGLYLCFNKANAESMKAKIAKNPSAYNLDVMTAHGFAYRHVARDLMRHGKKLELSIPPEHIELFCEFTNRDGREVGDFYLRKRLAKLVYDTMSAFCHSKAASIDEFKKEYANIQLNLQLQSLKIEKDKFYESVETLWNLVSDPRKSDIPFTHDVYLKLFEMHYNDIVSRSKYGFLIADEAQDLFPVVESLVEKINGSGARLLCLGDRYQQIYAWNKSINTMSRLEKNADILYLTKSFRCPENVTETALPWLRILGYKGNFIGRDEMDNFSGMCETAMISRTNSGVLLDINSALEDYDPHQIYLVGNGPSYDFNIIYDRINFENRNYGQIRHVGMKNCRDEHDYDQYATAAMDREMEQAKMVVSKLGQGKIIELIEKIKSGAFSQSPAKAELAISTAHKSKGLEFPVVIIGESFRDIEDSYMKFLEKEDKSALEKAARGFAVSMDDDGLMSSSELEAIENSMFASEHTKEGQKHSPMPFDAEELRVNYVALTRAAKEIYPGPLSLDEDRFNRTTSLLANGQVVLKDKNIHGNLALYNADVDYATLKMRDDYPANPIKP